MFFSIEESNPLKLFRKYLNLHTTHALMLEVSGIEFRLCLTIWEHLAQIPRLSKFQVSGMSCRRMPPTMFTEQLPAIREMRIQLDEKYTMAQGRTGSWWHILLHSSYYWT